MLGTLLRSDIVWDGEILADNLLFILILNNFPEHVPRHILYHSLCNFRMIPFLLKSLNYTIRNLEIASKMLGTVLRTDSDWEREIMADNLYFILCLKNFPEYVPRHILYHSLFNLMRIPFLSKFWTTLFGIERFREKCYERFLRTDGFLTFR